MNEDMCKEKLLLFTLPLSLDDKEGDKYCCFYADNTYWCNFWNEDKRVAQWRFAEEPEYLQWRISETSWDTWKTSNHTNMSIEDIAYELRCALAMRNILQESSSG